MSETKNQVELRELTKDNFIGIMNLEVGENQKKFVAPNSVSMAVCHFSKYAIMRGIFLGDEPVGFMMLADPVSGEEEFNGMYFLWRLMIDKNHQGKGYGKAALKLILEYVKNRPDADYLYSSYEPGEFGPEKFYLEKLGFEKTEKILGDEVMIRIKL
ncbi:MAG: GNAT family N-acetyltransferase [Promethearchaeota archaeon]